MARFNEVRTVEIGGRRVWVRGGEIAGCQSRWVVFDAWEPSDLMGPHATIMSADTFEEGRSGWFGRLGCHRFECELPASPERSAFVHAEFERQYAEAYAAIYEAFPEIQGKGRESMGSVDVFG